VRWIWLGGLLRMAGGLVSAGDRRFRRASVPSGAADAGQPMPVAAMSPAAMSPAAMSPVAPAALRAGGSGPIGETDPDPSMSTAR